MLALPLCTAQHFYPKRFVSDISLKEFSLMAKFALVFNFTVPQAMCLFTSLVLPGLLIISNKIDAANAPHIYFVVAVVSWAYAYYMCGATEMKHDATMVPTELL